MAENSAGGLELAPDNFWVHALDDKKVTLDPSLRRVIALIEAKDWTELYRRTGIQKPSDPDLKELPELPLLAELAVKGGKLVRPPEGLELKIPKAYFKEAERNKMLTHVTARLVLGPEIFDGNAKKLRDQIARMLNGGGIKRLSLAAPLQPCLDESVSDTDMPVDRVYKGIPLDGNGIVVGIIDDGCALAHQDFLIPLPGNAPGLQSRIQFLWDQSATATAASAAARWVQTGDFAYGLELTKASIDHALAQPGSVHGGVVEADKVHDFLGYQIYELASHGTHVMSIAAGNGRSLMGSAGVASAADIVFVQLPQAAIAGGGAVLYDRILDGVIYIFARAERLNKPAVINISYGGYSGPHDGTTELEIGIDQMLALPDRTVVVAAGNGFEADCHARGTIKAGQSSAPLQWVIRPEDPTSNYLEIWYNGNTTLELRLTPPGATAALGPVPLGVPFDIRRTSDQLLVGAIDHAKYPGNNDNRIVIILGSTTGEDQTTNVAAGAQVVAPTGPFTAPAPSGIWKIELKNTGTKTADFHAWIERDVTGGRGSARRQQSRFVPGEADPKCTLGGLATGLHTIAVGAYNTATQEICRYSACGPTRAIGGDPHTIRQKPEVCAPAEEDPAGRGTLSASSLRSQPTRMSGTSASAPHVAGLIALMYQYIRDANRNKLSADQMRERVKQGAQTSSPLKLNRHQEADDTRPHKQKDMRRGDLTGTGKINVTATLNLL